MSKQISSNILISIAVGVCFLSVWIVLGFIDYMIKITTNYNPSLILLFMVYGIVAYGLYGIYNIMEFIANK